MVDKKFFDENGYVVARSLFSPAEVETLREHFMDLREAGTYPGDMVADVPKSGDPLARFPRMIHMHRWDESSRAWLTDERINQCLTTLLEAEPYAVQTMLYFKPPGARGQALHQDNFYLQAQPGTCAAAWLALDDCDEENGCMQVVPGSHKWPILCAQEADDETSFTNITTPLPPNAQSLPVLMKAGDVLFFGGALVHGSFPNTSATRFRRSLIGHYVEGQTTELTRFDQPVLRMNGEELFLNFSAGGGPCGVWTEQNGTPLVEMSGQLPGSGASE
jgi:ectoine hydroxylase-related dioxygenase (phytanoyl-CoA dioxygenase family)